MKKLILTFVSLLIIVSCKKTEYSPEGPTDVRIRNLTDQTFNEVIVSTSEYSEDIDTINILEKSTASGYSRFKKAYPKAEIKAKINIGGTLVSFTTGKVDYTYMQYIGQDKITYEVFISNMATHELKISNVILDESLVIK